MSSAAGFIRHTDEIDESIQLSNTQETNMTPNTNTIRLHRVLRSSPEKVYKAFLDADALCKWLPPNGFIAKMHHFEPKVGGTFKMSFINFGTGKGHSFGGEYLELKPHELIRYTDRFDDPNLPGTITVTVTLKKVLCGTELNVVQEGVPAVIPAEMCYLGWQESLILLGKLVEADIPDA
jgi:uncharacterized protein YndB with AHSA1/START domain